MEATLSLLDEPKVVSKGKQPRSEGMPGGVSRNEGLDTGFFKPLLQAPLELARSDGLQ